MYVKCLTKFQGWVPTHHKTRRKVRAQKKKLKYTSLSCDLIPLDLCLWGHLKTVEAAIQNEDTLQQQQQL
jgi:hypothetical protein